MLEIQNNLYIIYRNNYTLFNPSALAVGQQYGTTYKESERMSSSSSFLEVEPHDGETKQEGEQHGESNVHHRHNPQEVMMETKVVRDKLGHSYLWAWNSLIERLLDITKLGGNQSV